VGRFVSWSACPASVHCEWLASGRLLYGRTQLEQLGVTCTGSEGIRTPLSPSTDRSARRMSREKYQRARWGDDEIRVSLGEESGPLSS
jgi:hypothetical protein